MPKVGNTLPKWILPAVIGAAAGHVPPLCAEGWGPNLPQGSTLYGPSAAAAASPGLTGLGQGGLILDSQVVGQPREHSAGGRAALAGAGQVGALRVNAGYGFGAATGYVAIGSLRQQPGSDDSHTPVVGIGMRVSLNRALQLSGEILHHEGRSGHGASGSAGETLSLQAAFRF